LLERVSGLDRNSPPNPQIFGNAGIEHMEKYGTSVDHFAKIAWKNHHHRCAARAHGRPRQVVPNRRRVAAWMDSLISVNNPYSQFQTEYSLDEVKNGRKIWNYLTLHQCCPTSDGAACAILASEDFVRRHNLVRPRILLWPNHPWRSRCSFLLALVFFPFPCEQESLAVEIAAQAMATDSPKAYGTSSIELAGSLEHSRR